MPQQPKGKARNNSTPHSSLSHYLLRGPACHCGRSRLTSSPSSPLPLFPHPHGPACHCGRSRLSTHFPNSFPSHLYTQPSVIPTSKARLVIVAGPASFAPPHFFLSITPTSLFTWPPSPHAQDTACYCCRSHPSTCFPPHPPLIFIPTPHPHHSGPACHCGRSRLALSSLSLHLSPLHPHLLHPLYTIFWARLTIVVGPAFPIFTTSLPPPSASPFCALQFLPISGPACHCGRSRLPLLLPLSPSSPPLSPLLPYSLSPSLSPLAAKRAPVAMGDPK